MLVREERDREQEGGREGEDVEGADGGEVLTISN